MINHKNAKTKTDPWDFDVEDTEIRMVLFSLLLAVMIIFSFQTTSAQRAFPMPMSDLSDNEMVELDTKLTRQEIQAAKDYQEIMLKLEFLFQNHLEYFSNFDNYEGRKYQNLLLRTLIKMEKGVYCANVEKLSSDLSKLSSSLYTDEKKLKRDRTKLRLVKNLKSLRSDIEIIEDILTEEIAEQLNAHKRSLKEIKVFLQQKQKELKLQDEYQIKMYELQELLNEGIETFLGSQESLNIQLNKTQMRELFEAEKLQKELAEVLDMVFAIELPKVQLMIKTPSDSNGNEFVIQPLPTAPPTPPAPPAPPTFPEHNSPSSLSYSYEHKYDGKSTIFNQYKDSVYIKSSKVPIYIDNQLGDLEIIGWDRTKVVAIYSYEVTSDDIEDAKSFSKSVALEIASDKSGLYITTEFPSLNNPKRQVIKSSMILKIPKKNKLYIENSFGKTNVSNFYNDISIKAKNSKIIAQEIFGNVNTRSKNSKTILQDIIGEIDVTSSRGDVIINDANSKIFVKNSNASIIIADCQGNTTLINSGKVVVTDHTGNLDIQNNNGLTTVSSLYGNLTLIGSYQPFLITSVDGSVEIENKNATISLSDITGESIVINQSGQIKAYGVQGPIDFSNQGGEIYFVADKLLDGNSTIRSDYGLINIVLPQQSDIILNASTEGGSITNSYQTKVKNDNFLSSTTIALGNKSNKLHVSGTNATIIIKDSK